MLGSESKTDALASRSTRLEMYSYRRCVECCSRHECMYDIQRDIEIAQTVYSALRKFQIAILPNTSQLDYSYSLDLIENSHRKSSQPS